MLNAIKTNLLLVLLMIPFGALYSLFLPHNEYVLIMTSVVGVVSFILWRHEGKDQ